MFSNHPQEVVGTVLNGFLITRFLTLQEDELISQGKVILQEAAEVCIQAERGYRDRVNVFEDESIANTSNAFSQTLEGLILQLEKTEKDALQWITDNASVYTNREIRHPSQGFVLTLIPLALHWLLTHEKKNFISSILTHGRETQKLGALTGSWIGAIYGAQVIPEKLKTGLVNSREIRLRGESLFHRRMKKNIKPLVDMETALTAKEIDETKRYQRNEIKKVLKTIAIDFMDVEEDIVPTKEDRAQWRKLQKEKTRNKRDRRKNIPDVIV
jgi:ADP-ribosylglycohydrolase